MDTLPLLGLTLMLAYGLGGVPFGYLVARGRGVDIEKHGSGNIGATNVGRVLGRPYGVLVFVLDFAKGAVPVALALGSAQRWQPTATAYLGVTAGLAAFLGHLFSPWLRFRGGKGVATGAGVVFVLVPLAALAALGVWLVVLAAWRYVSLASVAAALALCGVYVITAPGPLDAEHLPRTLFCGVAAALVVLRHRANLKRLAQGNENRLGETTVMQLLGKTLHVLAVGLWFGAAVFFTFVVGLSLFGNFEAVAASEQRPVWFPVSPPFQAEPGMLKEQGTRAAGYAVSPMFPIYYLLQGVCGFIAVLTALAWTKAEAGRRVHVVRVWVLGLALVTVLVGWPLAQHVSELRVQRNQTSDDYLIAVMKSKAEGPAGSAPAAQVEEKRSARDEARRQFGLWHMASLFENFLTVLLVAVGLALAAQLPPTVRRTSVTTPKSAEPFAGMELPQTSFNP